VPEFVANRACFELNGYFGSEATYDEESDTKPVTSYSKLIVLVIGLPCPVLTLFPCYRSPRDTTNKGTWFRCLVKMVRKVDKETHEDGPDYTNGKKDYRWFEMTAFTRWDHSPSRCQVLCVDTPFDFPDELLKALKKRPTPLDFRDPFAMHANLVDQMIICFDISVWRVRDPIRQLEKVGSIVPGGG
jgi:hypothetical protein